MKRAGAAVTRDDARAGEAAALADLGAMRDRRKEEGKQRRAVGTERNGSPTPKPKQQPRKNNNYKNWCFLMKDTATSRLVKLKCNYLSSLFR
jgi:hypothetical protein